MSLDNGIRLDGSDPRLASASRAALWRRLEPRETPDAFWSIALSSSPEAVTFHLSWRPRRGLLPWPRRQSIRMERRRLAEALRNGRSAQHISKIQRFSEKRGWWELNATILGKRLTLVVCREPLLGRSFRMPFHLSDEEQRILFEAAAA